MKKRPLILSICLIIAGIAICLIALVSCASPIEKIANDQLKTENYEITDSFTALDFSDEAGGYDVVIKRSNSDKTEIEFRGHKKESISYEITDGTLSVKTEVTEKKSWYEWIGIDLEYCVVLKLSESEYEKLSIIGSSGDVTVSDFAFDEVDFSLSSSDVELTSVRSASTKIILASGDLEIENCELGSYSQILSSGDTEIEKSKFTSLTIESSSGDVEINDSTAESIDIVSKSGDINIRSLGENRTCSIKCTSGSITLGNVISDEMKFEASSGDVRLNSCDAKNIESDTSSGDFKASLLSPKIFDLRAISGNIIAPETTVCEEICRVRTSSGDIEITIKN